MTLTLELPPDMERALAEEAQRRGTTPERVALENLRRLYPAEDAEAQAVERAEAEREADQRRRQAVLAALVAKAQARTPGPEDSPTRNAYRESPIDEAIVEKFRRQGFNL
jgi:predicted transcriptional regulator